MFDILIQVGKMVGILFFWYYTFYELPKLLKNGTFHTAFDLIKDVSNQKEYKVDDKRSKTTLSNIWLFIDKFVLTVPALVHLVVESWGWFTQAWNDLLIVVQNLVN